MSILDSNYNLINNKLTELKNIDNINNILSNFAKISSIVANQTSINFTTIYSDLQKNPQPFAELIILDLKNLTDIINEDFLKQSSKIELNYQNTHNKYNEINSVITHKLNNNEYFLDDEVKNIISSINQVIQNSKKIESDFNKIVLNYKKVFLEKINIFLEKINKN